MVHRHGVWRNPAFNQVEDTVPAILFPSSAKHRSRHVMKKCSLAAISRVYLDLSLYLQLVPELFSSSWQAIICRYRCETVKAQREWL
jgi:hypothetical protein